MATYLSEELWKLWLRGDLTVEQMLGHLFQHIEALETEVKALKKEVLALQQARKN